MEHLKSYWEFNNCSNIQRTSCILSKPRVHFHIHKSLSLDSTLIHIHPVHTLPSHFLKVHFNNIRPYTPPPPQVSHVVSFPQIFPTKTFCLFLPPTSATHFTNLIFLTLTILITFRANYEGPHYVFISSFVTTLAPHFQIFP
jgi:hypothetical protein